MNRLCIISLFLFSACSTSPKCGVAKDSITVFENEKSCSVRIRQVTIGSEMSLPKSVKPADLIFWNLGWSDSALKNGRIEVGHFVLSPPSMHDQSK